jgi:ABC-2 type transport system permease protein
MEAMMRYWRIWRRFVAMAMMQLLEYRASFALAVLDSVAQLGLLVLTYLVLYRFTADVAGWNRAEALLLLGIFWLVDGVWTFQFAGTIGSLPGLIQRGDLDFLLLRPVSAQFLVVCWRGVNLKALSRSVSGLLLVVYAAGQAGVRWSLLGVAEAVLLALCGLVVLYAIRFATAVCTFWVLQVSELYELFHILYGTARFPVSYFREPVRSVLTYVIPAAFVATFPAQALLGTVDHRLLLVGPALAGAACLGTHVLWRFAVRHYSSASS